MTLKEMINTLEEPDEGKAMNFDLNLYRQTLGGNLPVAAMFATLNKSQDEKARLWEAHVLRQALDAYGAYISQDHLDRWPRADLENFIRESLSRMGKADLHALMVVAQVLEGGNAE